MKRRRWATLAAFMRDRVHLFAVSVLVLFLELAVHPLVSGARPVPDVLHEHRPAGVLSRHVDRVSGGRSPAATTSRGRRSCSSSRSARRTASSGSAQRSGAIVDVGNHASPQLVFFGVEIAAVGSVEVRRFRSKRCPACCSCSSRWRCSGRASSWAARSRASRTGSRRTPSTSPAALPASCCSRACSCLGARAGLVVRRRRCWPSLYLLVPDDRLRALALSAVPWPLASVFVARRAAPPSTGRRRPGRSSGRRTTACDYRRAPIAFITVNLIGHQQMVPRRELRRRPTRCRTC